jgi:hypothetical protein
MDEDFDKVKLTVGHMHEACDRTFMLSSMFDDFLLQHPAVMGTPELKKKAEAISDALGDFYQASGRAMFDFDEQADIVVDLSEWSDKE